MASKKDIFEPKIFAAELFASGVWRGGTGAIIPGQPGITIRAPADRLHFAADDDRLHWRVPDTRLQNQDRER